MSIDSVVSINISTTGGGVTAKSFSIPMVLGKHAAWGQRVKKYESTSVLTTLISEGIAAAHPIYKSVSSIVQQSPKPTYVMVGRTTGSFTQQGSLTPIGTPLAGDVYGFTLRNGAGVATTISYTVIADDTLGDIATAIAALMTAVTNFTATITASPRIDWEADIDDEMWTFESVSELRFAFMDTTAAPTDVTIAADMAAIVAENGDFYGGTWAGPRSKAIGLAFAAVFESYERVFSMPTHDADCKDSGATTSIMYTAQQTEYYRSWFSYSAAQEHNLSAGQMGEGFPYTPGSSTFAFKTIRGVTADSLLSVNSRSAILGFNGNVYVPDGTGGSAWVLFGKVASGEYIDVVVFRDLLTSRLKEAMATLFHGARKIPYTRAGSEMIAKEIMKVLRQGQASGGLDPTVEPTVTYPEIADISDNTILNRHYPGFTFTARLGGAIHTLDITGVLYVGMEG